MAVHRRGALMVLLLHVPFSHRRASEFLDSEHSRGATTAHNATLRPHKSRYVQRTYIIIT